MSRGLGYEGGCTDIYVEKGMSRQGCRRCDAICRYAGDNMGKKMHRAQVYRIVNRIAEKAGINKTIGTHTFRRSRVTNLLNKNVDVYAVSRLLRHKSLNTTTNYLRLSTGNLKRKLEEVNDDVGTLC